MRSRFSAKRASRAIDMQQVLTIETYGQALYEFTDDVKSFVGKRNIEAGLLTLFVRHTSCSLLIQENADPEVQVDMKEFFSRLVPSSDSPEMSWITHTYEGPDDMPAHIKSALLPVSLSIPIINGSLGLGTWQGIYLFEHRNMPHRRDVILHIS
ncbi:secondary thiamine-phosphate synthase enzyme YjbQ [Lentilitoribacter sp. Alg239-R112]|uniref:secondary thiamine-phosphate synthase enzyme YjbQ n=1 Tax=Lentilitoribacter sp. Alg239-R112 TaxID=2305987 RepID=UPI001FCE90BA|nr:secondary thiamine-phosphate synthase enzyme YjbQ [Lentilitoribacter sp. Alg239-R112]